MVADERGQVIYVNGSMERLFVEAAADLREVKPRFDPGQLLGRDLDGIPTDIADNTEVVGDGGSARTSTIEAGARTFRVIVDPVLDASGTRLGTAIEWTDRTAEIRVENEVDAIVDAASQDNLRERIDLADKQGFFRRLSEGVNRLIDVVDTSFADSAEGNFPTLAAVRKNRGIAARISTHAAARHDIAY